MATDKEFHELIGRVIADPEFRAKMIADPEAAAQEAGYELTGEQVAYLKALDLASVSEVLEQRVSKVVI